MGRLLRYLIMFGPMLFKMYKKFTAGKQTNQNLPQQRQQQPPQSDYEQRRTSGTKSKEGKWDFEEGQNPLG